VQAAAARRGVSGKMMTRCPATIWRRIDGHPSVRQYPPSDHLVTGSPCLVSGSTRLDGYVMIVIRFRVTCRPETL